MNAPSFAELYRRSRYFSRSRPSEKTDKAEMQRLEEFATAALAFVLFHDVDGNFRNGFLQKICGLSLTGESFRIGVQSDHQTGAGKFDLTLISKSYVVVIESKVWAKLDSHQDPEKDFEKRPIGYGCRMIDKWCASGKKLVYVVLSPDAKEIPARLVVIENNQIEVRYARWCKLDGLSESSLTNSLLEWLGNLKIRGLMKYNFAQMKLATFAKTAWDFNSLLEAVRNESDLETGKIIFGSNKEVTQKWIGCGILARSTALAGIRQYGNPEGNELGWFGYVIDQDGNPRLSVWFYAGSEEKKKELAKRFSDFVLNKESNELICYQPTNSSNDFKWLIETLDRLKNFS
jgi:hypothetical protein